MSPLHKEFEDIENEFEDEDSENRILPAEILSETRINIEPQEEILDEKLSELLKSLPHTPETKFVVTRLADKNLSGQFRIPCNQNEDCDAIYWNGENEPSGLYSQVRKMYGGGLYRFRTHSNGWVKNGVWTQIIADPPELSQKEKLLREQEEKKQPKVEAVPQPQYIPQPQQSNVNSFDDLLSQIEKLERLKKLLAPEAPQQPPTVEPPVTMDTIKMELVQKALVNPELVEMAIRSVFNIKRDEIPEKEENPGFWASLGATIANSPDVQDRIGKMVAGTFDIAKHIVTPAAPIQQPTAPIETISFAPKPRNEPQTVSIPEMQPQPTETAQVDDFLPFIEVGETGE